MSSPAGIESAQAAPPVTAPARPGWSGPLTLAFGSVVAMWAVGWVGRLPGVDVPPWALGLVFLALTVAAGALAGRTLGGVAPGASTGAIAALLNFLVLGSVLHDRAAGAALPGSLLAGAALGALGAALGRRVGDVAPPRPDAPWAARFARVTAAATLLLLVLGGVVTSHDAGLAVPDWPNSYGSNMFLFPLERMTGGIYYEHSHRLVGSLVGLTTLTLLGVVFANDRRPRVRGLAGLAFALVCVQGLLGGLRVTGTLTLSQRATDLSPSTALAVVHGVTGQLFLSLLVLIAALLSPTWTGPRAPTPGPDVETDRGLTAWLLAAVLVQLVLGALVRHVHIEATWHICMAVAVITLAGFAGLRAWGSYAGEPVLPRVGLGLVHLVGLQLVLGVAALAVTTIDRPAGERVAFEVPIATAHQTTGALILAAAVLLFAWERRLLAVEAPKAS